MTPHFRGDCFPLLRHVLSLRPEGFAAEFGVGVGTSLRLIAARMPVVGFDSFAGLPEEWREEYPAGSLAFPRPRKIRNARIVSGWFADTLPRFDFDRIAPLGLVHVDCDLYSSTKTVLEYVGPYLRPGCFVVFDEWFACGYADEVAARHEQRAWREYVGARGGVCWDVVGRSDEEWAIRLR